MNKTRLWLIIPASALAGVLLRIDFTLAWEHSEQTGVLTMVAVLLVGFALAAGLHDGTLDM